MITIRPSTALRAALTGAGLGTALLLLAACGEPTDQPPQEQNSGSIAPSGQSSTG
jgi:hypothetical protein